MSTVTIFAARRDGARCPIADLEERHQAGGGAAAGKLFALAADPREIGPGAGAVLEKTRFADPQIHDAAFVHQIVGNTLDETGMGLRPLVGRGGRIRLAVFMAHEPMALTGTVDAIGPVQTGVEPLRRVGCADLGGKHEAMLVIEGARILFAVEVAALPSPVGPGAGHSMEHLTCAGLAAETICLGHRRQSGLVGHRAPQELGQVIVADANQAGRHSGATEILLGENVRGDLRPVGRYVDVLQLEDDGAVGVADFGVGSTKRHSREWRFSCLRIPTLEAHRRSPVPVPAILVPCRGGCSIEIEHAHVGTR
jgi:hypothetical protein